jgi:hypothetical protein
MLSGAGWFRVTPTDPRREARKLGTHGLPQTCCHMLQLIHLLSTLWNLFFR